VVGEFDAHGRSGAGRRGNGIPVLRRKEMVNEVVVGTPFWAREKKNEWLAAIIDSINEELSKNPKMSLAEYAKNLDKALVGATFDVIKRTVDAQFDKE
jgi:hypothetical protein